MDADRDIPVERRGELCRNAGVTPEAITAAALESIGSRVAGRRPNDQGAWPWIVSLGRGGRRTSARQYCPACLAEDATPHYRIGWRLAWHTGCARHGRVLVDRCARCDTTQQLQHLRADARHVATCTACGADLWDAAASACYPNALEFQQAGDHVIKAGEGRCFDENVDAAQWFAVADFLCSLVRQTARSPTKGLSRMLSAAGIDGPLRCQAAPGARIELLGVKDRQALLEAVWCLMRLHRDALREALAASGVSREGLLGGRRNLPRGAGLRRADAAGADQNRPTPADAESAARPAASARGASDDEAPRAQGGAHRAVTGKAQQNTTRCDECRRDGVKIARVHRGERFCQTCYKRLFKRRMCPKCGNFARLPRLRPGRGLPDVRERAAMRAMREDPSFRIGMRTSYGPACIGCTPYFKPPEPCEACGTESRWLSRRRDHGARTAALSPMRAKGQPRNLCGLPEASAGRDRRPGGRRLCRACREQGEIPCPECSRPMPAGCGRRCWTCYWEGLARRRTRIGSAGLASPVLGEAIRRIRCVARPRRPEDARPR